MAGLASQQTVQASNALRDQLAMFRTQHEADIAQQRLAMDRARFEAEMAQRQVVVTGDGKLLTQREIAELDIKPKKPRHFVNYDKDLLPELRKWRDEWLKM